MDEPIKTKSLMSRLAENLPAIYNNWVQTHITQIDNGNIKDSEVDTLPYTFVLSVSDGHKKAKTVTFIMEELIERGEDKDTNDFADFEKIIPVIYAKMDKLSEKFDAPIAWLRLEWLNQASLTTWASLQQSLKGFKRNYYRSGIAFAGIREPWLLLTEMELNANACLYAGNTVAHAKVNTNNLSVYFKARHGSSQLPNFYDDLPVISFNTAGIFLDEDTGTYHNLDIQPRFKGHRKLLSLSAETTQPIIELSTQYLSRQVKPSGQYVYGYFPCFGRTIDTYNSLRHASSTYALIEGYEACRNFDNLPKDNSNASANTSSATPLKLSLSQIQSDIDKAMGYLTHQLITTYGDKAYVIDTGGEIKLGANAVAILALVKYLQVFTDTSKSGAYHQLAEKLALGIIAMQQKDGSFVHVLNSKDLSLKAKNRIIYYDGEAAFALMRLYGLTKDERWLNCVTRAFDYFIEAKHHEAHDHWLSYCSNELIIYKPEKKYFQFAVDNIKGYTDFIKNRITTFPTLLELSMAFHKMLLKLDEHPEFHEVLAGFDTQHFYQALHARANHLMNGFFFPEMAMFYKVPQTILHGFFIRHHSFRVRIDDVEHYLSGLIAYQYFLKTAQYPKLATKNHQQNNEPVVSSQNVEQSVLTARALVIVTNGRWLVEPAKDWSATGVCIWPPSFKSGHIIVARGKTMATGYLSKKMVESLVKKGAAAIVTDDIETYKNMDVPVLYVRNVRQATIDIGRYTRQAFAGQIIGITGSAGKTTTVHMLAHTLNGFGEADYTQSSANLPVGIAWNLTCMPQSIDYWVLEMAIGSMSANTDLVRPDVALITNIAPAHLEYHHNVENIALKKARIFEGMAPGSLAVVCRDIEQYELIERQARIWGLRVISYGKHDDAMISLLSYSQKAAQAKIVIDHQTYTLTLSARGQHMVLNAMAILAVAKHYHLSIETAITRLASFRAIAGRGQVLETSYQGIPITLYDEAYNANPLSMQAALETFQQLAVPAHQKILILGDMLELGNDSRKYHLALAPIIEAMDFRALILVGEQIKILADPLKQLNIDFYYTEDAQTLTSQIHHFIKDNDHVFIKASNGIGLNKLFLDDQNRATLK